MRGFLRRGQMAMLPSLALNAQTQVILFCQPPETPGPIGAMKPHLALVLFSNQLGYKMFNLEWKNTR